jgi:hypothetical protein
MVVHMSVQRSLRRFGVAVQGQLGKDGRRDDGGGSGEQAPTRKFRHD